MAQKTYEVVISYMGGGKVPYQIPAINAEQAAQAGMQQAHADQRRYGGNVPVSVSRCTRLDDALNQAQ